jgi:hypothetical protein
VLGVGTGSRGTGVEVEDLTDRRAPLDELRASRLDVRHDQVQAVDRSRRHRVSAGSAHDHRDRARGTARRQLHDPEVAVTVVDVELEIEPVDVEVLGPVDIGDRKHDHLKCPFHLVSPVVEVSTCQDPDRGAN